MTTTDTDVPLCRCGHERHPHEHLRRGSNCSRCNCPRWRTAGWRSRALGAVRGVATLAAAVVLASVLLVAFAYAVHGVIAVIRAIP